MGLRQNKRFIMEVVFQPPDGRWARWYNSSPLEVVGLDIEGFEGCFRDLDALRIEPPVDVTGDREAGFCFG